MHTHSNINLTLISQHANVQAEAVPMRACLEIKSDSVMSF